MRTASSAQSVASSMSVSMNAVASRCPEPVWPSGQRSTASHAAAAPALKTSSMPPSASPQKARSSVVQYAMRSSSITSSSSSCSSLSFSQPTSLATRRSRRVDVLHWVLSSTQAFVAWTCKAQQRHRFIHSERSQVARKRSHAPLRSPACLCLEGTRSCRTKAPPTPAADHTGSRNRDAKQDWVRTLTWTICMSESSSSLSTGPVLASSRYGVRS